MSSKKTEAVDISVDELALSLVGWQVEDAQARLITESDGRSDHQQQIALSATLRFLPEDWIDRFEGRDDDNYTPKVFLTLNRRDTPAPSSTYMWVAFEKIKKAKKGLIRIAEQSDTWTCQSPSAPKDIDLRLTAYDLDEVSGIYINKNLCLPNSTTTPIEINVVDETSVGAPRPEVAVAHAYISKGDYRSTLTVHTEGTFEFGSAEHLLKEYLDRSSWEDSRSTLKDTAPFQVAVPEIMCEILDNTGFLLDARPCNFYGHIPVDSEGDVPRRQPRWIGRKVINIDDLSGAPQRVVVRFTDSDE